MDEFNFLSNKVHSLGWRVAMEFVKHFLYISAKWWQRQFSSLNLMVQCQVFKTKINCELSSLNGTKQL